MDTLEKIEIEIPAFLLDSLKEENEDVNKVINVILKKHFDYKKKLEEELKKGYEDMGIINLGLANSGIQADNEALALQERFLTESE